ncbi:hypothetical protein [Nitrosomonas sp. Nm58]|uniref:hypothetical protein n=1 Tax=Nitrosomonas sp. Nm58 TaxID=200126 RepID=UPI0015A5297D|nr:hypothetical protein [Nitrosomonas sp. Nm58]
MGAEQPLNKQMINNTNAPVGIRERDFPDLRDSASLITHCLGKDPNPILKKPIFDSIIIVTIFVLYYLILIVP